MAVLTVGVVATIATAGAAAPAAAGAAAGIATGLAGGAGTAAVGTAVGAAAAGGTVVGSVAGASVVAASGATAGAIAGGGAIGAATGAASGAAYTAGVLGVATGPLGWVALGADVLEPDGVYTFDCWKMVLHDESTEPSKGRLLREVASDPRIRHLTTVPGAESEFPRLVLQNIWDEKFLIQFLYLPSGQLAAHAVKA
uniref:Uncharacterized protein n=1 Tax=Plectus sambesii TaxID=2011161 RepID=A0A914X1Q1_9BILA